MIQPGLIPLQPNLDFMDTFEPFQGEDPGEAWMAGRTQSFPQLQSCSDLQTWELPGTVPSLTVLGAVFPLSSRGRCSLLQSLRVPECVTGTHVAPA